MLPKSQGGVVDANLRVHGLKNVRVIDASVPPIALSTHLMASTYGVAEIGAAVVREYWNDGVQGAQVAFSGGGSLTNSSVGASASATGSKGVEKNGAGVRISTGTTGTLVWGLVLMVGTGVQAFV
jgi:hypothetical protein